MKTLATIAALMLLSATAFAGSSAPNVYPKEHVTSAAGACHEVRPGDARLAWAALNVRNISAENVQVACSPGIDISTNGAHAFGAVLSNFQSNNRSMSCTAQISSGGGGSKTVARSVIVGPATSVRIAWTAEDMGDKLLVGGQAGFVCTLPPGSALSWVWTIPGA